VIVEDQTPANLIYWRCEHTVSKIIEFSWCRPPSTVVFKNIISGAHPSVELKSLITRLGYLFFMPTREGISSVPRRL